MRRTSIYSLRLLCALALCISAYAQEKMVNLHFISLPRLDNPEALSLLTGEGQAINIELPTNNVSKGYQVPALATWEVGKASVAKGKFKFESYAKVKSINVETQLILVVRISEDDGGGIELIPIDYTKDTFGGGKYYFINIADRDIEGTLGESEFKVKTKEFALLAPEPTEVKGTREYCSALFSYYKEEKPHPFFSSTWRFNKAARSLVFFYIDPKTQTLKFHTVRNYVN